MTFLVTGATGNQGGGAVKALLSANQEVHALVRSLDSEPSRSIEAAGVVLHKGDFDDKDSVFEACKGRKGLFLNVTPLGEPGQELRHARNIISAAKEAGVEHVIYSSVLLTGNYQEKDIAPGSFTETYFQSKSTVEETVRTAGFKYWTIIRPGTFMTNFLLPGAEFMYPELMAKGVILSALSPTIKFAITDPTDVGKFTAAAFLNPSKFHEKEIDVGYAPLTMGQVADALSASSGKRVQNQVVPEAEARAQLPGNFMYDVQLACNRLGDQEMDFAKAREWGIPLTSFEDFLKRNQKILSETIGPKA